MQFSQYQFKGKEEVNKKSNKRFIVQALDIIKPFIMIVLLMSTLLLIVTAFSQNAHPLHLPLSDVENVEMNADLSDVTLKKVMEPCDAIKNKRRFRRSYGQKSKCIIERKAICKMLTINKITKNICLTFHMRKCVGLD